MPTSQNRRFSIGLEENLSSVLRLRTDVAFQTWGIHQVDAGECLDWTDNIGFYGFFDQRRLRGNLCFLDENLRYPGRVADEVATSVTPISDTAQQFSVGLFPHRNTRDCDLSLSHTP